MENIKYHIQEEDQWTNTKKKMTKITYIQT